MIFQGVIVLVAGILIILTGHSLYRGAARWHENAMSWRQVAENEEEEGLREGFIKVSNAAERMVKTSRIEGILFIATGWSVVIIGFTWLLS